MAQKLGPNMAPLEELTLSPGELTNHSLYSNKGVVQGVCVCMCTHVPTCMSVCMCLMPSSGLHEYCTNVYRENQTQLKFQNNNKNLNEETE